MRPQASRQVRRRHSPSLLRWVVGLLFVLLVVVVAVTLHGQNASYQRLQRQNAALTPELEVLREENRRLTAQIANIDSDTYIEDVARNQLGMVRSNEIVFVEGGETVLEDADVLPNTIERQVGGE